MPLTDEQRAEINRENASKSTGPKSEEGKASSRRNAIKHGLRARVVALPNEDAEVVAARSESWNAYYQPQSPAAQHLVNECVAATLLSDRCHQYHAAALAKQVRSASWNDENRQQEQVEALVVHLKKDPELAVRRLAQTARGCRALIERWERLDRALADTGLWHGPECDEAIRLQGFRPEMNMLKECPPAWTTRLCALCTHEKVSTVALEKMFRSDHFPEAKRGQYSTDAIPVPEECVQALREMIADRLGYLREQEMCLREDLEVPDQAEAADRALILHDGPSAKLFLRYHAEARNSFHKSFGALLKTLDRDAAGPDETAGADELPNEASAVAPTVEASPTAAEELSPNEADSGEKPTEPPVSEHPLGPIVPAEANLRPSREPLLNDETPNRKRSVA